MISLEILSDVMDKIIKYVHPDCFTLGRSIIYPGEVAKVLGRNVDEIIFYFDVLVDNGILERIVRIYCTSGHLVFSCQTESYTELLKYISCNKCGDLNPEICLYTYYQRKI